MDQAKGEKIISAGWSEFTGTVLQRMQVGAREYGDKSFEKPADQLADEIEQELADVMGWGFILWHRIQGLKAKLIELEERG